MHKRAMWIGKCVTKSPLLVAWKEECVTLKLNTKGREVLIWMQKLQRAAVLEDSLSLFFVLHPGGF